MLALICQARGEWSQAIQLMETAYANIQDFDYIEGLRDYLALLQGRTNEALAWAERQEQPPVLVPKVVTPREAPMILIKTLVSDTSAESMERAALLLPDLLATARTSHAHFLTAELLALQTKLSLNQGNREGALAHLREAVMLVRRVQPLRLFADLGLENSRSLIPLLEELQRQGVAPEYLPRLLDVLRTLNTPRPTATPTAIPTAAQPTVSLSSPMLVESLTPREGEILVLMAQGMSNREIGEHLFLSAKTVENYSLTLYAKLDVKSRGQAVAKARQAGMLPR
jgi:ATP/maltotriose-dependent transcriptional regulator MalT